MWSLDDMAYVDTLFGHQSDVLGVAPQRKERVVTVGRDRTCRFWKVAEDSQLIFRPGPSGGQLESVAFTSPDTWITGADDGTVALWSTTKKRAVMEWKNGARLWRGDDRPKVCNGGRGRRRDRVQTRRPGGVRDAGGTRTARGRRPVRTLGQRRGRVQGWRPVRVRGGRRGDSHVEGVRRSGRQLMPLFALPARGFVNSLAVASSGRFVLAGMGQEPRQGRWGRDVQARNGLLMHRLTLER